MSIRVRFEAAPIGTYLLHYSAWEAKRIATHVATDDLKAVA